MSQWIEQLLNGFALVGPLLLIALSLSVVVTSMRVLNVAVGATFVTAAIVGIWSSTYGLAAMALATIVTAVVLSVLIESVVLRWQRRRGADAEMGSFAATLGLALVIIAVMSRLTESQTVTLPPDFARFSQNWLVGGVRVRALPLGIFAISVLLALAWGWFLHRRPRGLLYRAAATDRELARSIGVRPDRLALESWLLCGLFIGVSATLVVIQTRAVVAQETGSQYLLIPFAAVVAGGIGSLSGTVIATFFFGFGTVILGRLTPTPGVRDLAVFALLFVLMVVRPNGLGRAVQTERDY